jgi:hypothetical protein
LRGLPGGLYDLSPKGDRFLLLKPAPEQPASNIPDRLVVVENWIEELKQKVPTR